MATKKGDIDCQFIQERINSVENHMSNLCSQFGDYVYRTARLRDDGDDLAKAISAFASQEILNNSLQSSMARFSVLLSAVQDYRETEVQRLHHKVVIELSAYEHFCKKTKEESKKHFMVLKNKEIWKKKNTKKIEHSITAEEQMVEKSSLKLKAEGEKAANKLAKLMNAFERKKLDDLKRVFMDFIHIELLFHTKAVELLSKAYREVESIDIEEDMGEFHSRFQFPCFAPSFSFEDASIAHKAQDESNETAAINPEKDTHYHTKTYDESSAAKTFHPHNTSLHPRKNARSVTSDISSGTSLTSSADAARGYQSFKWTY